MPVADNKQAGGEKREPSNNEKSDPDVSILHLTNAPLSVAAPPHARSVRFPRPDRAQALILDRGPGFGPPRAGRHVRRGSRQSAWFCAPPFVSAAVRRSQRP